jgi:hypothetical protein
MSDFFKFEYIDPKNIILNKNNEDEGTFIEGTKSGIQISTFQQPTHLTFKNNFIGGYVQEVIRFRGNAGVSGQDHIFSPSINDTMTDGSVSFPSDSIIIYQTGQGFSNIFSKGPYLRLGYHNIISEVPDSRLGIGTLFPAEKVHISGGNLRVDGGASFSTRPTVNGTGILLSGEAASLPATIVYTTGTQTISGAKNFATRPQVNNIGVVISGEAYPSNNPSGYITGVDLSSYYLRNNPSGFITGVNLSSYITTGQTGAFYPASNPSGFITGVNLSSYITTGQTGTFYPASNPSGFITGVDTSLYVTKLSGQFTNRPTVNGTGILLSGEAAQLPDTIVYTTGDQTISGTKTFIGAHFISGNTTITGHLAATSKSFLIDHPTQIGKKLQYGSLESPYHGIRLTDKNKITANIVKIDLPKYISSLVHENGVNIQLTNINHDKILFVKEVNINDNHFVVGINRGWFDKNEYEFYWTFTAERKDIPKLETEF